MTHLTTSNIEERHRELEDLRRKNLGMQNQIQACRTCYVPFDEKGCVCGRNDWTYLTVVVIEMELLLEQLNRESRTCNGQPNCEHCLQVA